MLGFWAKGQLTLADDFTDGDFLANPVWSGDTSKFEVDANLELHLNDSAAGTAYLSTPTSVIDSAFWEFYVRLEFNPSSSNNARVYLVSDNADLNASLNGYYLRIGGSSADRISLYSQTGNSSNLILETGDDWVDESTVEVRARVSRSVAGLWTLQVDTGQANNYALIGSSTDLTHTSNAYFGWVCNYTVTRADKLYLDDINLSGKVFIDNTPPRISTLEVISTNQLQLFYSEIVEETSAEDIANYQVNNSVGLPDSAVLNQGDERTVDLYFSSSLQSRVAYELYANDIEDLSGNRSSDTIPFSFYIPEVGDVVFNELMVDPVPSIGLPPNNLPEREYIELYNRTNLPINLDGWSLIIGSTAKPIPSYVLEPDSFAVIVKDIHASEFSGNLPLLVMDISSTSLTNGGQTLSITSSNGLVINSINYSDTWYQDANKDDGGWSLEQIDPGNTCGGIDNWRASDSPNGGTPGGVNSVFGVNPDVVPPAFERFALDGDSALLIFYTERIEDSIILQPTNYRLSPNLNVSSVEALVIGSHGVRIQFANAIASNIVYRLSLIQYPSDCSGNRMLLDTLEFALPEIPQAGDLLINEILFNPPTGGADFVEIYNSSTNFFDLKNLRLGNWDPDFEGITNTKELVDASVLIPPGSYKVFTTDKTFVTTQYRSEDSQIIEVESMPSMNDSEGSIALSTSNLSVLDYFEYEDDFHLSILKDDEGVSLERVSFDKASQDADNWQSAAATAGYATPSYQNSQSAVVVPRGKLTLEPKVFSPNQDGYHDQLGIGFQLPSPNGVVSINIWSSEGYLIRELNENINVSQEGTFFWDGVNNNGQLAQTGIYIIVLDYYDDTGEREVLRETCVLSL